jgi:hypothetical protein
MNMCNIVIEISNQQIMKAVADEKSIVIVIDNDNQKIKKLSCGCDSDYVNNAVEEYNMIEKIKEEV